jgi:hypothetical protein
MTDIELLYPLNQPPYILTDDCTWCGKQVEVKNCPFQLGPLCETCYEDYKQKPIPAATGDLPCFD